MVGTPATATAAPSANMSQQGTWPTGSSPLNGHLIVAFVCLFGSSTSTLGATPAGYFLLTSVNSTGPQIGIYTKTATGSDTAPTFTGTTTGTAADSALNVILFDLQDSSGGTPVSDTFGTNTGTSGTIVATTSGNISQIGELQIAASVEGNGTTAATTTWTGAGGWDQGPQTIASLCSHMATYWFSNAAWARVGSTSASITFTHGQTSTHQVAATVVFKPPAVAGSPYPLCTGSSTANTTTFVQTIAATASNVAVGDMIVVTANNNGSLATGATSCTDSGSNTYVLAVQSTSGTGYNTAIFVCKKATTALTAGTSTITVNYSSGTAVAKTIEAFGIPGLLQPVLDSIAVQTSTAGATTLTLSSGTMTYSREILVASCSATWASTNFQTWSNGWEPISPQDTEQTCYSVLSVFYATSQAAVSPTVTFVASNVADLVIIGVGTTPPSAVVEPGGQDVLTGNIVCMGQAIATASQW
jgi:hypothetical protein